MKLGFSVSAEHIIRCPVGEDLIARLLRGIYRHTHWTYSCTRTEAGYILKPIFRKIKFGERQSFVPEITIAVSQADGRTVLQIQGQPADFIRAFMYIWIGSLMMMGILTLVVSPWPDKLLTLAFCSGMGVFGYLLCKLSTKSAFGRIVKAIQKELP